MFAGGVVRTGPFSGIGLGLGNFWSRVGVSTAGKAGLLVGARMMGPG